MISDTYKLACIPCSKHGKRGFMRSRRLDHTALLFECDTCGVRASVYIGSSSPAYAPPDVMVTDEVTGTKRPFRPHVKPFRRRV